mmetsp:Transcript_8342/g.28604  ORF Transcript_8342/g.28604 Transcript_8342/m.28604 type:complete len:314 (-) Transcript_8342:46-987(-)
MQFVDEEDRVALLRRLGDDGLEALLELAAVLGAGDEHGHLERVHALAQQLLGHVAVGDALREALRDGRLADARVAHEAGVRLAPPQQDLHDPLDDVLAPDHGVELAVARQLRQVDAARRERRRLVVAAADAHELALGALRVLLDLLGERGHVDVHVVEHDDGLGVGVAEQREQQVLAAHLLGLERRGLLHGDLERRLGPPREGQGLLLAPEQLRDVADDAALFSADLRARALERRAGVLQGGLGVLGALQHAQQDLLRAHLGQPGLARLLLGVHQDIDGLGVELVEELHDDAAARVCDCARGDARAHEGRGRR